MIPETCYARSGRVDLAYKVLGDGPRDLVFAAAGPSHLEVMWELPEFASFLQRLARLGRVIVFDKRGSGLSDRTARPGSLEQRADDVVAVMDAAGSRAAVLIGYVDAGATFLTTAARHPARVAGVIAGEVVAASRSDGELPWGWDPAAIMAVVGVLKVGGWGRATAIERVAPEIAADGRLLSWLKRYETMAANPAQAARLVRENSFDVDLRPHLPAIRAPVRLVHHVGNPLVNEDAMRWLARLLPDAELRAVSGGAMAALVPGDELLEEIEDFLTGTRVGGQADRRVCTLLFTDIVESTAHLTRLGNKSWRWVLATHHTLVRRALARHGGREIDTAGDGFFVTFDLPSAALRCASDVVAEAAAAGVQIRAGLHAGEVEVHGTSVTGMAVNIAARVAALAGPSDVLVTDTVRVLAAGTGQSFEPIGERELKGLPGRWELHRLRLA
jgi:class 3 adenylate cyclase